MRYPQITILYGYKLQNFEETCQQLDISDYYYEIMEQIIPIYLDDIIQILQKQGVEFDEDNIHYFDEEAQRWNSMILPSNNVLLQINRDIEDEIFIRLLLSNQTMFIVQLCNRIQQLEENNMKLNDQIQRIANYINIIQQVYLQQQRSENNNEVALPNLDLQNNCKQVNHQQQLLSDTPIKRSESHNNSDIPNHQLILQSHRSSHHGLAQSFDPQMQNHKMKSMNEQPCCNLQLQQQPFIQKRTQSTGSTLELCILYSEPLVTVDKKGHPVSAVDPVEFEVEIHNLKEVLLKIEKAINMRVEVANMDNLTQMISKDPTVLHFICHGDFNKDLQSYVLLFEKKEKIAYVDEAAFIEDSGKQHKTVSNPIQKLLSSSESHTRGKTLLVFVNACHSEEVGKIFLEAGVPFVIAVQSELKIDDKAASVFSKHFYNNIFSGKTINASFEQAQNATQVCQGNEVYTCCCAHKHTKKCNWQIDFAWQNYGHAHEMHKFKCQCPRARELWHKSDCNWALQYLEQIDEERYNDCFTSDEDVFVCCCGDPLTIQHNESMKFRLMVNETAVKKMGLDSKTTIIFPNLPSGQLNDMSNYDTRNHFPGNKIQGRNLDISNVCKMLVTNRSRFVLLYGEVGIGKTELAKQVANYLHIRGYFKDGIIYKELDSAKSFNIFQQEMKSIKVDYPNFKLLFEDCKHHSILIILNYCDDLLKSYKKDIVKILRDFKTNTHNIQFIIISVEHYGLDLNEEVFQLSPLNWEDAYKLIQHYAGDYLPNDTENLQELLQTNKKVCIPNNLMAIVQNLKHNKSLTKIIQEIKIQSDQGFNEQEDQSADLIFSQAINSLKQDQLQAYNLLLILSQFPFGLAYWDLQAMMQKSLISNHFIDVMKVLISYANKSKQVMENLDQNNAGKSRSGSSVGGANNITHSQVMRKVEKENAFEPGEYFWMKIENESQYDFPILKIKKCVTQQLIKLNWQDYQDKQYQAIEYLAFISRILIKNTRKSEQSQEQLIEYSSLSQCGVWAVRKYKLSQEELEYLSSDFIEMEKQQPRSNIKSRTQPVQPKDIINDTIPNCIFSIHQKNFKAIFTSNNFEDIVRSLDSVESSTHSSKLKQMIEEICVNIPTIFYLNEMLDETEILIDQSLKYIEILRKIDKCNDVSLKILHCKMYLMQISHYISQTFDANKLDMSETIESKTSYFKYKMICDLLQNLFQKLEIMEEKESDNKQYRESILLTLLEVEVIYLKAHIINKSAGDFKFTNVGLEHLGMISSVTQMQKRTEARNLIKDGKHKLQGMLADTKLLNNKSIKLELRNLQIFLAKFQLLDGQIYQQKVNYKTIEKDIIDQLKKSLEVFAEYKLTYLEILNMLIIVKIYMAHAQLSSTNQQGVRKSQVMDKQGITTQELLEIRKKYMEPACIYCGKIKEKKALYAECRQVLLDLNEKIRSMQNNVFQFMRSAPLVYRPQDAQMNNDEVKSVEMLTRITSQFKSKMENVLKGVGKSITAKFDILSSKNFITALQQGCSLLFLQLIQEEHSCFILEHEELPLLERHPFQQLIEYYEKNRDQYNQIDVIILGVRHGSEYIKVIEQVVETVNSSMKKYLNQNENNNYDKRMRRRQRLGSSSNSSFQSPYKVPFYPKNSNEIVMLNNNNIQINVNGKGTGEGEEESSSDEYNDNISNSRSPDQISNRKGDMSNGNGNDSSSGQSDYNSEQEQTTHQDFINKNLFKMPHILTFEFKDSQGDFVIEYLQQMAIQYCVCDFVEQLIKGETVELAFDNAKDQLLQKMIQLTRNITEESSFIKVLGEGPVLLPQTKNHKVKIFNKLNPGQVENISPSNVGMIPTNLERSFKRFTGRNKEIYLLVNQLIQKNSINLYGPSGIGKSEIAYQIAQYCYVRALFKNGVYLFNMNDLKQFGNNLKELLKKDIQQENFRSFFQMNKSTLLIFDNFDIALQMRKTNSVQLYDYVFSNMAMVGISFIAITHQRIEDPTIICNPKNLQYFQLDPLSQIEGEQMLFSQIDLENIDLELHYREKNRKRLDFQEIYKAAEGNPGQMMKLYEFDYQYGQPKIPSEANDPHPYYLPTFSHIRSQSQVGQLPSMNRYQSLNTNTPIGLHNLESQYSGPQQSTYYKETCKSPSLGDHSQGKVLINNLSARVNFNPNQSQENLIKSRKNQKAKSNLISDQGDYQLPNTPIKQIRDKSDSINSQPMIQQQNSLYNYNNQPVILENNQGQEQYNSSQDNNSQDINSDIDNEEGNAEGPNSHHKLFNKEHHRYDDDKQIKSNTMPDNCYEQQYKQHLQGNNRANELAYDNEQNVGDLDVPDERQETFQDQEEEIKNNQLPNNSELKNIDFSNCHPDREIDPSRKLEIIQNIDLIESRDFNVSYQNTSSTQFESNLEMSQSKVL